MNQPIRAVLFFEETDDSSTTGGNFQTNAVEKVQIIGNDQKAACFWPILHQNIPDYCILEANFALTSQ